MTLEVKHGEEVIVSPSDRDLIDSLNVHLFPLVVSALLNGL